MAESPVSPKVTVATVTTAVVTLVMYLLDQLAFVAAMPGLVRGALLVLITAGVTGIAAYWKKDPLRILTSRPRDRRG